MLSYPDFLRKVLTEDLVNYKGPSQVQKLIYEQMVNSKRGNLIVQSKNGTGKTLAFSSLMIHNLSKRIDKTSTSTNIAGLIITPTREIAL